MEKDAFLEAGKIVNTHGIHGEVRIEPWADSPAFLANINTLYIDGNPVKIISSRIHKSFLLVTLDGVSDVDHAIRLKNKVVYISRDDIKLEDGRHFIVDLIGLRAIDTRSCEDIGLISDIMPLPANNVYVITSNNNSSDSKEILIPAVPDFVEEINKDAGYIKFRLIEGFLT